MRPAPEIVQEVIIQEVFLEKKIPLYRVALVREEPSLDCLLLNPDDEVTKLWVFRNEGDTAWPSKNLAFVSTSGQPLCDPPNLLIPEDVLPGQEIQLAI